jgi:hypothetical protein
MANAIEISRTDKIRIALGAGWLELRLSNAPQKRMIIPAVKPNVFDEPDMPGEPESIEYGIEDALAGLDAAFAYCDAVDHKGDTKTTAATAKELLAPASVVSACVGAAMAAIWNDSEVERTCALCETYERFAATGDKELAVSQIQSAHDKVIRLVLTGRDTL